MIEIALKKATKDQLEAELQMYRDIDNDAIVVPAADSDELSNTSKRIAEIERLRKEFGVPVNVTQEFIDENPALELSADDVGSVVLLGEDELQASQDANAKDAADKKKVEDDAANANGEDNEGTKNNVADVELDYLHHRVTKVTNAIAHGKMHKDVHTADGQSFRLSFEEYNRDVKPRNA